MQALINLERAWVKASTEGYFNLSDRTRYMSRDGQRWASLIFPTIGKPEYRVYRHEMFDPSDSGSTKFRDLGTALDFLNLFLEGTAA